MLLAPKLEWPPLPLQAQPLGGRGPFSFRCLSFSAPSPSAGSSASGGEGAFSFLGASHPFFFPWDASSIPQGIGAPSPSAGSASGGGGGLFSFGSLSFSVGGSPLQQHAVPCLSPFVHIRVSGFSLLSPFTHTRVQGIACPLLLSLQGFRVQLNSH